MDPASCPDPALSNESHWIFIMDVPYYELIAMLFVRAYWAHHCDIVQRARDLLPTKYRNLDF